MKKKTKLNLEVDVFGPPPVSSNCVTLGPFNNLCPKLVIFT